MHNITFVNKENFVKLYNNFVLKWLIFALYVVVVLEYRKIITNIDIGGERLEDTLRICDVSAMGLFRAMHGDLPYWCLNIFSRIQKSIVSRWCWTPLGGARATPPR
jgi:hypothetical protein